MIQNQVSRIQNLRSKIAPTWCPGCHDYIIFAGLQQAIAALDCPKEDVVIVYDIGCVGNMADYLSVYGLHGLHGRCIPTAVGVKFANPKLKVIALGGDGGIYGEGLNHLIAAARLNLDVTVIVANNRLYSLTTGQTSPTTPKGTTTKSTPLGAPAASFDPLKILPATNSEILVKHVKCQQPLEVTAAMKEALNFPGFALLDLDQLCVTFGKHLGA